MKTFNYEEFIAPYKQSLDPVQHSSRIEFLDFVIPRLVNLNRPINIVETGCMHTPLSQNAGANTLLFADLIKNVTGGQLTTIDISSEAIVRCKVYTLQYSDVINYVHSDSVSYLKSLSDSDKKKIDLLFLDSWDLYIFDPLPSSIHHLLELNAVYDLLKEETIIAVDDNFMPNTLIYWNWENGEQTIFDTKENLVGKGLLIDRFLRERNWKFAFEPKQGISNIFTYIKEKE
jgi:predicted O-methyltransferase YrrM